MRHKSAGTAIALVALFAVTTFVARADTTTGGEFSRSPASGPPGQSVAVASVDPCPPEPPPPNQYSGGRYVEVQLDTGDPDNPEYLELDPIEVASDGSWSGAGDVPDDVAPGSYTLKAVCEQYRDTGPCPDPGSGTCLPRSDGYVIYHEYTPQPFTVCAAGTASCVAEDTTTTSTVPGSTSTSTSTTAPSTTTTTAVGAATSSSTTSTTTTTTVAAATTSTTVAGSAAQSTGPGQVSSGTAKADDPVTFSGDGFAPNSRVNLTLQSDPIALGSVTTDASGAFRTTIVIPKAAPPGSHTIIASGLTPSGATREVRAAVVVQDLNCTDFRYREDAQAVLDANRADPHGLDADRNGLACESLPRKPSSGLPVTGAAILGLLAAGLGALVIGAGLRKAADLRR